CSIAGGIALRPMSRRAAVVRQTWRSDESRNQARRGPCETRVRRSRLQIVTQTELDFSAQPPINGRTPQSRHSSWTGAVHAAEARSANMTALRQLWREPRTMNEVSAITGLPMSSVCSLKSAIEDELEVVDMIPIEWGPGRRATKRCRWRLKAK